MLWEGKGPPGVTGVPSEVNLETAASGSRLCGDNVKLSDLEEMRSEAATQQDRVPVEMHLAPVALGGKVAPGDPSPPPAAFLCSTL